MKNLSLPADWPSCWSLGINQLPSGLTRAVVCNSNTGYSLLAQGYGKDEYEAVTRVLQETLRKNPDLPEPNWDYYEKPDKN